MWQVLFDLFQVEVSAEFSAIAEKDKPALLCNSRLSVFIASDSDHFYSDWKSCLRRQVTMHQF